jgi:hypothetical protein
VRICLILFLALQASAATTAVWEMNSFGDFLRGRLRGVTLTADGRLRIAPSLTTLATIDQPQIWTAVRASDGTLFLGTGHRGQIYKVEPSGRTSLLWTSPQPEIFAMALDAQGGVFVGASPQGTVYRIANGRAEKWFELNEQNPRYVWALTVGRDGALYVGTGEPGRIYRVTAPGKSEIYFDSEQGHITALAWDSRNHLLAGSEPNGLLFRITAKDRGFVLLDANLPEIRSILPASDGSLYVAAMGGSLAKKTSATPAITTSGQPAVSAPAISITVTDAQAQLNPQPKAEAPKTAATQPTTTAATAIEQAGVEKSAIYRVNPDGTFDTLWTSKEENVYDLHEASGRIWFGTDNQGRIYQSNADRSATLITETGENEVLRLITLPEGALAITSGKILRLGATGSAGTYESPVHDAGSVARWGRLWWVAQPEGLSIRVRTGNSSRPDKTWSDWSAPITQPGAISAPNARFIQWKAELSNPAALLDSVSIAYLPQNTAPTIRSITVSSAGATKPAAGASTQTAATYSISVTDTGESSTPAGTQAQTASRSAGSQLLLSWQADDPESDKLSYTISFRGEEEREWKQLRANITENTTTLDPDSFADGRYYFRVIASDRPSNAASAARESELVSTPVLIDNTPPSVRASVQNGVIEVTAEDRSPLRRCEYSIDAGPWLPVEAVDGVTDSPTETFRIEPGKLNAGEHLVVIRVTDSAGNAGLAKLILR